MTVWTIKKVMDHHLEPHWTEEVFQKFFPGRDRVTILEVLAHQAITHDLKIRLGLAAGDHVPRAMRKIRTRFVENHLMRCGMPNTDKWAANWYLGRDYSRKSAFSAVRKDAELSSSPSFDQKTLEQVVDFFVWPGPNADTALKMAQAYPASFAETRQQVDDLKNAAWALQVAEGGESK